MNYDEHLISEAGGDGDVFDIIAATREATAETFADRMARKSIEAKKAKHAALEAS